MAGAGPHLSSKTVGYLVDCPSETQMFHLPSNAAFLRPNPWMLALLQQKYFQTELQHFCVQLCRNICQILSSSSGNKAKEFAHDYIAHKWRLTDTQACTLVRVHAHAQESTSRHTQDVFVEWKLQYSKEMSNCSWWSISHILGHVHTKHIWSRTLVYYSLSFCWLYLSRWVWCHWCGSL